MHGSIDRLTIDATTDRLTIDATTGFGLKVRRQALGVEARAVARLMGYGYPGDPWGGMPW